MFADRRVVLALLLAAVTLVTVGILRGVLGTIFFAITVAYVLLPVVDRLEDTGLPKWWSAATATAAAFGFGLVVLLPILAVLYVRRSAFIGLLRSLPREVSVDFGEFVYVIDSGQVVSLVIREVTGVALSIGRGLPVIAAKLVVFAFVVFALLYRGHRLHSVLLEPVPDRYHDIVQSLHERVRETLWSLYLVQASTAVATFVIALVVFLALGIRYPVTLAVIAGVLQFLPVVGPSIVVVGLGIAEYLAGDLVGAAVITVVGLLVIGILPDAVLRPRLARESTRLPASLYFVGFTGGILSLGALGIVAGPLAVVLVLELLGLLATEVRPVAAADGGRVPLS